MAPEAPEQHPDQLQESGQLPEEGPAEQVPDSDSGRTAGRDAGPDRQRNDDRTATGNPGAAGGERN